jgi:hypothetical protein
MNTSEAYQLLKESGFTHVRDARHGEIWTNGVATVMLAHGGSDYHRQKKFVCDIKRAVRAKKEKETVTQPKVNVSIPVAQEREKSSGDGGPQQLPDIIIAILLDGRLTDGQKIKMIFAYTEL